MATAAAGQPAVQIFGYRDSRPTQAALRFFRERRIGVSFVDLDQRRLARGELTRFSQKFGPRALLDDASRAFRDAGLAYLRLDDEEILDRLLANPRMIRLPLVRSGNRLTVGEDAGQWRGWLDAP